MLGSVGLWAFVAVTLAALNCYLAIRAARLHAEREILRRQVARLCERISVQAELLARWAESAAPGRCHPG